MSKITMREVFPAEWASFFDTFSRRRQGWIATLQVLGSEFGAQTEARQLALEGIVADAATGGGPALSILMGEAPDRHVTRYIPAPSHVRLEKTETARGVSETLEIESDDGITTLLRFDCDEPLQLV